MSDQCSCATCITDIGQYGQYFLSKLVKLMGCCVSFALLLFYFPMRWWIELRITITRATHLKTFEAQWKQNINCEFIDKSMRWISGRKFARGIDLPISKVLIRSGKISKTFSQQNYCSRCRCRCQDESHAINSDTTKSFRTLPFGTVTFLLLFFPLIRFSFVRLHFPSIQRKKY